MNQRKYCPKKNGLKILKNLDSDEKSALKELQNFIKEKIDNYSEGRNFPNISGTSKLSPFIKFGQLHVETIWNECSKKIKNIGTSKIFENRDRMARI